MAGHVNVDSRGSGWISFQGACMLKSCPYSEETLDVGFKCWVMTVMNVVEFKQLRVPISARTSEDVRRGRTRCSS